MRNNVLIAKKYNKTLIGFDDLVAQIGNKSVFDEQDLRQKYTSEKNLVVIEMLYYGYFGIGNNVNMDWLDNNRLLGGRE